MKNTDISFHLPKIENKILQLKAICDINISKTALLKVINSSNIKLLLKKNMQNPLLNDILESAVNKKILNQKQIFDNPRIIHLYSIIASSGEDKDDNFKAISDNGVLVHNLRSLVYFNDAKLFNQEISLRLNKKNSFYPEKQIIIELAGYFKKISFNREDESWLNSLDHDIQYHVVAAKIYEILNSSNINNDEYKIIMNLIENNFTKWHIKSEYISELFAELYFLTAKFDQIKLLAKNFRENEIKQLAMFAVIAFLEQDYKRAIVLFEQSLKLVKSLSNRRNVCLSGIYGICHIFALFKEQYPIEHISNLVQQHQSLVNAFVNEIKQYQSWHFKESAKLPIWRYFNNDHETSFIIFETLVKFLKFRPIQAEKEKLTNSYRTLKPIYEFQSLLVLWWLEIDQQVLINICEKAYKIYFIFPTITLVIDDIRLKIQANNANTPDYEIPLKATSTSLDFINIITIKPEWERSMEVLEGFLNSQEYESSDKRLVWMLYPSQSYDKIIPFEQKRQNNGLWNKGRNASLKRLYETGNMLDYLSYQDKQVIKTFERSYHNNYDINENRALIALANHPLVFDGNTGEHLELIKTTPELIIEEINDNYKISLSECAYSSSVKLKKESKNKYQIIDISGSILEVMKVVGNGIKVPKAAKERVLSFIKKAATNLNIRTELNEEDLVGEPGDNTIIVQLHYIDQALKIKMCVRPFGEDGPYYNPGIGNRSVFTKLHKSSHTGIANESKLVIRDLDREKNNAVKLIKSCPSLRQELNHYDWVINDLEQALEILYELNEYKNQRDQLEQSGQHKEDKANKENEQTGNNQDIIENIIIEWPYGQSIMIDREISFKQMKLSVKSHNQWFDINGEIELEENQVLEMQHFLMKLENAQGRFIKLSDNKFIALTKEFSNKILQLKTIAKVGDKNIELHKLASPLIKEFTQQVAIFQSDRSWKEHIDKISASEKYEPKVPKNLKAELRSYQIEGYKWLSRLAYLGFGACLADDMGLGKTVQTIALLLEQASLGPCLVISPASVCYVWEDECRKFAPDLNCKVINQENRAEQINNLGKMDVLVCSYAILYQIEELITAKNWQVVVLDEAQAIKNYNTKRFKIALQFKAQHRVALSGTPVENHIEELWNLFEFLNPGFLGSRQMFQAKYVKPIQENNSQITRDALKNLIKPFILRRLKNKVLDELPAKTETTLLIDPSPEEKNFYEALRRESLERISVLSDASAAKKRFSVLAEITKLRRACCDFSLVNSQFLQENIQNLPNIENLQNSKLAALDEIIIELKENNHRALIFSQYVDYLHLVKLRLEKQNISLQYLDGSVTQKQRRERVEAFQAGEGDVFLISLKAGGVGLNLTSADYVIHLDPWWNPAIEDQASDRAHRIGQKRAVTIYRLVMKHSIEEKILKMHDNKRDMAISLLTDADKSASLTEGDLLKLIHS